jgi:hypothetical protein
MAGVRLASGGNVSGAVDACGWFIALPHTRGARLLPLYRVAKKTAARFVAFEFLLVIPAMVWQYLEAWWAL